MSHFNSEKPVESPGKKERTFSLSFLLFCTKCGLFAVLVPDCPVSGHTLYTVYACSEDSLSSVSLFFSVACHTACPAHVTRLQKEALRSVFSRLGAQFEKQQPQSPGCLSWSQTHNYVVDSTPRSLSVCFWFNVYGLTLF